MFNTAVRPFAQCKEMVAHHIYSNIGIFRLVVRLPKSREDPDFNRCLVNVACHAI